MRMILLVRDDDFEMRRLRCWNLILLDDDLKILVGGELVKIGGWGVKVDEGKMGVRKGMGLGWEPKLRRLEIELVCRLKLRLCLELRVSFLFDIIRVVLFI